MQLLGKMLGDPNKKEIKAIQPIIDEINELEPTIEKLSDEELAAKTKEFRSRLSLYLKGGMVLEDELVKLFDEALDKVEPLAAKCSDAQLHAAIIEERLKIERQRDPEHTLRDDLRDTLSECFEKAYESLNPTLNTLRVSAAMDLAEETQVWPDEAKDPHQATLALLKKIEPALNEVDDAYLDEAFEKAWPLFEEAKRNAANPEDGADERLEQLMGKIYKSLGLTVGVLVNAVEPQTAERRAAYNADITYGTNNEFGFDYLRDNMVGSLEQQVQRELTYAIVDEVDNILIDEARTPLIISGQGQESTDHYVQFARWAPRLQPETDYTIEEKTRTVILTEAGIEKIEKLAGVKNIYSEENLDLTRYMENAIKAHIIFKRDKDYIVKDDEVIIVDEFTGRQMPGRRYSEGLHQAIEAKEGVSVQRENHTLATITFQNYFRLYEKLAGMTGTALTEAEELHKIYKLDVISIPTHKPMIREDFPDLIYRTTDGKFRAVSEEIKELHAQGQPVLVGTTSVEISEHLSELLDRQGISHNVLNAKHHEREAQIVAQAGRSGAVTIATNMAGRGTDIVLGGNPAGYFDAILRKHAEHVDFIREMPEEDEDERAEKEEAIQQYIANMSEEEKNEVLQAKIRECEEDHIRVVELGGLRIIGTERHESRRIDNQLRGRSGRQGDPGSSRFFLSLEDELMRRFAADRVSKVMQMVGMDEDMPLESGMVSRFIEQAQTRVEGYNFDIRKNVVDYDDVIAKQREVIYADRRAVLERADMHERVLGMMRAEVRGIVDMYIPGHIVTEEEQLEKLFAVLETWVQIPDEVLPENIHAVRKDELTRKLTELVINHYEERSEQLDKLAAENPGLGIPTIRDLERSYTLQIIDRLWMDHIDALDVMRASIHFRSIGQRDPLVEFKNEAFRMFDNLKMSIQHYIVDELLKLLHGNITITVNRPEPQRKAPRNLRTNIDDIAKASGQAKSDGAEKGTVSRRQSTSNRQNGNGRTPSATSAPRPIMANKIGRNDPCPCGSGKKYKKCHGA